jgi:protein-S-isoprenylcysteine O-methyltransferase Ste14
MAAVGFALWLTARIQLGKSFSVRARARALVTTGLYSKFRHPIYLFGGVAYAGLLIAWGKLIPLV